MEVVRSAPFQCADDSSHAFQLHLAEVKLFPFFSSEKIQIALKNRLFVWLGTSCSGKTSLSKSISQQNARFKVLEHDDYLRRLSLKFFKEKAKSSFEPLFSLFGPSMLHYISCSEEDYFWKKEANLLNSLREDVVVLRELCKNNFKNLHEAAFLALVEDCKFLTCLGFNIVVHVVGEKGLSHFIPLTSQIRIVYCPLNELFSRIKQRNIKALNQNNPLDIRYYSVVLEQFARLFKAKKGGKRKSIRENWNKANGKSSDPFSKCSFFFTNPSQSE